MHFPPRTEVNYEKLQELVNSLVRLETGTPGTQINGFQAFKPALLDVILLILAIKFFV
jgi:hypothetical protein